MPSCSTHDPRFTALLDRFGCRIEAKVDEVDGNRFDIGLTVDGLEIACLRLRGAIDPVLLYTTLSGKPGGDDARRRVRSAAMTFGDDCERCGKLVRRRGDHTCPPCAAFLGRSTLDPFWGDFASHPDSKLLPTQKEHANG